MIDQHDSKTGQIFPIKRGRGRPKTGTAQTGAERTRKYREQLRKMGVSRMISVTDDVTKKEEGAEIAALRAEIDQLRGDNAALVRLIEKKDEENRDLARALAALKAGKRPRDLAKKGLLAADPA